MTQLQKNVQQGPTVAIGIRHHTKQNIKRGDKNNPMANTSTSISHTKQNLLLQYFIISICVSSDKLHRICTKLRKLNHIFKV
jgi:hypothetical protein